MHTTSVRDVMHAEPCSRHEMTLHVGDMGKPASDTVLTVFALRRLHNPPTAIHAPIIVPQFNIAILTGKMLFQKKIGKNLRYL